MPAKSERQRQAAGAALAAKKRGSAKGLRSASKGMYESMTGDELADFASKAIEKYLRLGISKGQKERYGVPYDKGEGKDS